MSLTKLQLQKMRSTPWWGQIKAREFCSPAEHVQTAERLAKEHDGILPRGVWLRKNGFGALSAAIYIYPELFSHIQQESLCSPADHVQTAERLAKEHNGILPRGVWLRKNGFSALTRCMSKHPELFSHIQQVKNILIKPFEEARDLARTQGFNSRTEYARWAKNIAGMPVAPYSVYKDKGWTGWGDFIGTEIRPQWLPFAETKAVIRAHGIKTCTQFKAWGQERRANKIPSTPHVIYKNTGWAGWGDFFSTEKRPRSHWLSFAEAKAGVRAHGIKTQAQFRAWPKRFANKIPLKPERVYKNAGWISWYDFLDKEPPKFKTYADCHPDRKHFARGLCAKCYERKRERKRPLVAPERPLAVFEREAELVEA